MDGIDPQPPRLLRREEVERRCGICRSTVYRLIDEEDFPAPVRIGSRAVRWRESDIDAWIRSRPLSTQAT